MIDGKHHPGRDDEEMSAAMYFKTDAGRQEIQDRALKLPPSLRSLLVMIDGQRSVAELGEMIAQLRLPGDALDQLLVKGLIEARGGAQAKPAAAAQANVAAVLPSAGEAERYKQAYALTNEAIGKHLGLKGYFLQLKLERCTTLADLEELAPEVAEALAKAKSDALAKRFLGEVRGEPA